MIHFESIFVKSVRSMSRFFFANGCPIIPAPFFEKTILSTITFLCPFVKDQLTTFVQVFFCTFYSTPLIYVSILSLKCCLAYCSLMVSLEVR